MPIVVLTPQSIKNQLVCPPGKSRIEYCDKDYPGLYVEVRAASCGGGTYYLRYKDQTQKTCHQKIGRTEDLTLAEARKRFRDLKAEIQLGADPRADAKAQKAVPTFTEFFNDSYLPYAKQHKRSWTKDQQLFTSRVESVFGALRLNEIRRQAVQNFLGDLNNEGLAPATADHHIKLIRQILNRAVEWEVISTNPVARIKLFNPDNRMENRMEDEDLKRLLTVLNSDDNRGVCDVALFLLATGARLNEALSAIRTHIDLPNRTWRIPAANSKSKRVRSVPLNDTAIDVLKRLPQAREDGGLFVSEKTGEPLKYVHKVWERLREKAGLPNLRLHDLRHQFASFLVNSGRSLYEVQKILGHSSHSVTERYAHLSQASLLEAANSATLSIQRVVAVQG